MTTHNTNVKALEIAERLARDEPKFDRLSADKQAERIGQLAKIVAGPLAFRHSAAPAAA